MNYNRATLLESLTLKRRFDSSKRRELFRGLPVSNLQLLLVLFCIFIFRSMYDAFEVKKGRKEYWFSTAMDANKCFRSVSCKVRLLHIELQFINK